MGAKINLTVPVDLLEKFVIEEAEKGISRIKVEAVELRLKFHTAKKDMS